MQWGRHGEARVGASDPQKVMRRLGKDSHLGDTPSVTPPWAFLAPPRTGKAKGLECPQQIRVAQKITPFQAVPHGTARLVSPDTYGLKSKPPTHILSSFHLQFSLTKTCTSQSSPLLLKFRQKCSNRNSNIRRAVLWWLQPVPSS